MLGVIRGLLVHRPGRRAFSGSSQLGWIGAVVWLASGSHTHSLFFHSNGSRQACTEFATDLQVHFRGNAVVGSFQSCQAGSSFFLGGGSIRFSVLHRIVCRVGGCRKNGSQSDP